MVRTQLGPTSRCQATISLRFSNASELSSPKGDDQRAAVIFKGRAARYRAADLSHEDRLPRPWQDSLGGGRLNAVAVADAASVLKLMKEDFERSATKVRPDTP